MVKLPPDLCDEVKANMVGPNLRHPLMYVDEVMSYPPHRINQLILDCIAHRDRCIETEDIIGFVRLHVPEHRWRVLLAWDRPYIRDEIFYQFLGELWTRNGIFDSSYSVLTPFLFDTGPVERMMSETETQFLATIPSGTNIYRGADEYLKLGLSWTLRKDIAAAYATYYGSKAVVWKTEFSQSNSRLYFDRAGEQEIIIRPNTAAQMNVEMVSD